jgi:hypothetical protein
MNIFAIDPDPIIAARSLCLQHRNKMLTESVQLLQHCIPAGLRPWALTHHRHPCTVAILQSPAARAWLILHAKELARLNRPDHASSTALAQTLSGLPDPAPEEASTASLPRCGAAPFHRAAYKSTVEFYRSLYVQKALLWAADGRPMRYQDEADIPDWLAPCGAISTL